MNMLKEVNPQLVQQDPRGETRWYSDDVQNVYLIRTEDRVLHLEISIGQDILICRSGELPAQGRLSDDKIEGLYYKASRTVEMLSKVDSGFMYASQKLVETCMGLEHDIQQAINKYFSNQKSAMKFADPIPLRNVIKATASAKAKKEAQGSERDWGDKVLPVLGGIGVFLFLFAIASFVYKVEIGCQLGKAHACMDQAKEVWVKEQDPFKAMARTEALVASYCQSGDVASCQLLFEKASALAKTQDAIEYAKQACALSSVEECYWLGSASVTERELSPERRAEFLQQSCKLYAEQTKLPKLALSKSKYCSHLP